MPSYPSQRKRVAAQPVASGAIIRIMTGLFGSGSPIAGLSEVDPRPSASIYQYHEGDLFTPGSQNFVFESIFELPIQTIWGNAFLRRANTFNPIQPPQVFSQPNVMTNGIGGIVAGDIEFQNLINPDGDSAPFSGDFTYDTSPK
jgi:hypothetical protein